MGFNPRARVGRDEAIPGIGGNMQVFQSTRPRGARQNHFSICFPLRMSFNPRARVGRDAINWSYLAEKSMFQSTRPRGARRRWKMTDIIELLVSIHAPAWGATAG